MVVAALGVDWFFDWYLVVCGDSLRRRGTSDRPSHQIVRGLKSFEHIYCLEEIVSTSILGDLQDWCCWFAG